MQKVPQGAHWAEDTGGEDTAEIVEAAYFLWFANVIREMRECMAERGGFEPPIELLTL